MRTITVTLPRLHQAQQQIKRERKRFNVLCNGRRFGKNVLLQDFAVEDALAGRAPVAWSAPTYKQLLEDWRTLGDTLAPVVTRKNEQEKQLALMGGGTIDFWSLENPDAIRGRKYRRFIVNEAGIVPSLLDVWNAVIRPTLIDLKGGAYFSGTPKGMNGFWHLFNEHGEDWARWQMSSYANPHIDKAELDALRNSLTERAWQQEIMAQFLPDGSGVFRNVRALSVLQREAAEPGREYLIGVDWGRTNDNTVCSVWDIARRREVALDTYTGVPFGVQYERVTALAKGYNDALVMAEANAQQDAHIEELAKRGVRVMPFTTTNATKAYAVERLAGSMERGDVQFQDDEGGMLEMEAMESSRTPSGLVKFAAPEGLHDDVPMARMIAYSGIAESGSLFPWE